MTATVALVPAYERVDTVGVTVAALLESGAVDAVVAIDDGSSDETAKVAEAAGATVVRLATNVGKGGAVAAGVAHETAAGAARYLLVDADLGATAAEATRLLDDLGDGAAMTIAVFPLHGRSRGFGLVKRAAASVLEGATGRRFDEPLSGQRAVSGDLMRSLALAPRFGLEVGLTLDAIGAGASVREVPLDLAHRPTGRDLAGVRHRMRQGRDLLRAAADRLGWWRTLRFVIPSLWRRPS